MGETLENKGFRKEGLNKMNKKEIKKRDLTKIKESTIIGVPSELVNVNYKQGITKLMLHIFLYNYGRDIGELYFSTTAFLNWFEKKDRIQSRKKREVEEIIKDWEKEGLITVLENVTNDVFKIQLEENFYVYGKDKYYKSFVKIYADEVEKILDFDCEEEKEIEPTKILLVFLYLRQNEKFRKKCMFLTWIAEDLFNKSKTNRVNRILELLEEQKLIYYKKSILKKSTEGKFYYTEFQYFICYERDLKNKVEYYGEEFVKQKLKELEGEEDCYEW